jgi:heme exporter protein B
MTHAFRHFFARMTRDRGLLTQSFAFFALAILVCVFAIGSDEVLLIAVLPSLAWAVMLLSALLGLPELLEGEDLDDLVLSRQPLPRLMLAKLLAHWAATGLPIALLAPPALAMMLPGVYLLLPCLWTGLLLGSLGFSAIGLLGSALTLGSRRNAALQALIVLPLCIAPLIFGAGCVTSAQLDMGWKAPMAFLGAFACASVTLSPFAAAWIVRMKVTSS